MAMIYVRLERVIGSIVRFSIKVSYAVLEVSFVIIGRVTCHVSEGEGDRGLGIGDRSFVCIAGERERAGGRFLIKTHRANEGMTHFFAAGGCDGATSPGRMPALKYTVSLKVKAGG